MSFSGLISGNNPEKRAGRSDRLEALAIRFDEIEEAQKLAESLRASILPLVSEKTDPDNTFSYNPTPSTFDQPSGLEQIRNTLSGVYKDIEEAA